VLLADVTLEWCCSNAEACITGQGQYDICGSKFLRPKYTNQDEEQALGIKSIPALTLTSGQPIGTLASQVIFERTTVQTGEAVSSNSVPSSTAEPIRSMSKGSGLSSGAIAGIVIGAVAGLALLGVCLWLVLRRRAKKRSQPQVQLPESSHSSERQQAPSSSEVEAKEYRQEAPTDTRHEMLVEDKPKEAPGQQMRHELGGD
jgi:hypothetical protein